jgi:hypothetical protein
MSDCIIALFIHSFVHSYHTKLRGLPLVVLIMESTSSWPTARKCFYQLAQILDIPLEHACVGGSTSMHAWMDERERTIATCGIHRTTTTPHPLPRAWLSAARSNRLFFVSFRAFMFAPAAPAPACPVDLGMMSCSIVNCMQLATYAVFVIHTTFTATSNFSCSELRMQLAMNGERVLSIVTRLTESVHLFRVCLVGRPNPAILCPAEIFSNSHVW